MIAVDKQALICDLAEVYHIFDYRLLPVQTVATLSNGLRENSRIWLKMHGEKIRRDFFISSIIADRLGYIYASLVGANPPDSIVELLFNEDLVQEEKTPTDKAQTFETGEEFKKAWRSLLGEK